MMGRQDAQSRGSRRSLGGQGSQGPPVCQEPDLLNTFVEEQPTLYQWMRWSNCKTHKPHLQETYPTILPPISKCSDAKTLNYIEDAMLANKCDRLNEHKEDVLTVWNYSPQKETLGWYGVGSEHPTPQAAFFDRALQKSLKAASLLPKPPKKSNIKPKWQIKPKTPEPGAYVLNRRCLKAKLDKMPNVRRQLKPSNAFSWLHCPQAADAEHPFEDNAGFPAISREQAMDMAKPEKPPKHGLRRKHWYCPPKCGEAENKCTDYEWAKYKLDSRPYDEAFQREMAARHAARAAEPRNYEELYKSLVTCFVQDPNGKNDLCEALEKCCKDPKDPPAQGCGEFVPDGPGGDGESGDGKDKNKDKDKKEKEDNDKDKENENDKKNKGDGDKDGDRGKGDKDGDEGDGDKGEGDKGDGTNDGKKDGGKNKKDNENDKKDNKEKETEIDKKGDKEKDKDKDKGKGKGKKKKTEDPELRSSEEDRPLVPRSTDTIPPSEHTPIGDGGGSDYVDSDKDNEKDKDKKKDKDKGKGKGRKKKPKKDEGNKDGDGEASKDCPCEICCPPKEEDTPLIKEMRRRDRERQVRDYLRQMRHRQYMECKDPDYPARQHKCDPIQCNSLFCSNPRLQTHFARVQAVQQLQGVLRRRNRRYDGKISSDLDELLSRLCNRLTQSVNPCG
ncbi:uncharacterized protein [Drosophila suzukii]|uniref:Uncharacterized protein isoform X1 n=1 Tax=Drosophila suzukii TaxID=28584 RepID=A0AB39ZXT1_DROSZ